MDGWIKLHRKMTEWGWYSDANTMRVFLHLLLTANHKPSEFRGRHIERGQTVFGVRSMSVALRLSSKEVRTALEHLKQTNEVAIEGTNKFSVATIVKYEVYQCTPLDCGEQEGEQNGNPSANERQTNGKPRATSKNIRMEECKKERNVIGANAPCATDGFEDFWMAYPKKKSKGDAIKAWKKIKPEDVPKIMRAIERQRNSVDWTKNSGQYIPYPASWLNSLGWQDEVQTASTNTFTAGYSNTRDKNYDE